MSKLDDKILEIKTQLVGQSGKRVLLLEGADDLVAFQSLLSKANPSWEQHWCLAPAGNKSTVLNVLGKEASWIGVVDRDEWADAEIADVQKKHGNLFVLPRFCIESYLINPAEIWAALPPVQREKLPNGIDDLKQKIELNRADWIRHAALWQVIHPMYRRMRDSGQRDALLDPQAIPDEAKLKTVLASWLAELEPNKVVSQVNLFEQKLKQESNDVLYHTYFYAKKFYPLVVHTALDKLLGQKSEKDRVKALFRTLPLPVDLEPLWQKMALR